MDWLFAARWSPYAAGIAIGIVSWLAFLLSDRPLGCSTAFAKSSGMIEGIIRGKKAEARPYFRVFIPEIDWEWMLVLGILAGSFLSAFFSGIFSWEWVPAEWARLTGKGPLARFLAAFLGGAVMGFGARWAGGCTSGHGISGTLQLALSGWLAVICFFAGGIAAAAVLFGCIL